MRGGVWWVRYPFTPVSVGGAGVVENTRFAPLVSSSPTRDQPTVCTLALWWLKFGLKGWHGGGGGGSGMKPRFNGFGTHTQKTVVEYATMMVSRMSSPRAKGTRADGHSRVSWGNPQAVQGGGGLVLWPQWGVVSRVLCCRIVRGARPRLSGEFCLYRGGSRAREETVTRRTTCPWKHSQAGGGRPECGGECQLTHPQYISYWAPLLRNRHQQEHRRRSDRQNAATRCSMQREERVTVQGPVKKYWPDRMSHGKGGGSETTKKYAPEIGLQFRAVLINLSFS